MKKIFLFINMFIFVTVAENFSMQASCLPVDFWQRKSLRTAYFSIRSLDEKCSLTAQEFLDFSQKAALAERYAEALWAAEKGLSIRSNHSSTFYQLKIVRGKAFLGLGRIEEAIWVFSNLTKSQKLFENIKTQPFVSMAHQLLIESYYLKARGHMDENVSYLIHLYQKKHHSQIQDLEILEKWISNIKNN